MTDSYPIPIFDTLEELSLEKKSPALQGATSNARDLDYAYAYSYLQSYRGSEATFSVYRREIERLLQWCWFVSNKSLHDMKRAEIEDYIQFCMHPPEKWIGHKQTARFISQAGSRIPNPSWRPFVKKAGEKHYMLSESGLQGLFSVLSSFFNFLVTENHVDINPVAQIRQKSKYFRKRASGKQIRRLSGLQWHYVIETAEQMANTDPTTHERTLFIMNALYAMYLRVSELVTTTRWSPKMGDFTMDHDGNWWFTTVGKGNKERQISVSDDMLKALKRYRRSLNLSDLPALGEATPLIKRQRGAGPVTSTRMIRHIVQNCFDNAITRLHEDKLYDDAESLKAATVHWLRHTGISEDVKHRPREHVRDDAGHSSSAITDRYIDIEMRERAQSAKKKPIKPDD